MLDSISIVSLFYSFLYNEQLGMFSILSTDDTVMDCGTCQTFSMFNRNQLAQAQP